LKNTVPIERLARDASLGKGLAARLHQRRLRFRHVVILRGVLIHHAVEPIVRLVAENTTRV
jgi:hypothetical protein